MTGKKRIVDILLIVLFLFSFIYLILRIRVAYASKLVYPVEQESAYSDEEFDPSLIRLNTVDKLGAYCDSLYEANYPNRTYPGLVSEVLRKRFFHGYSYYAPGENPVGIFFAPFIKNGGVAAIVVPDDILRYQNAACSQQSIVGMEVFKRKGYQVRKVSMYDSVGKTGHFAYEVNYDKGWHFFDTNQEPSSDVLKKHNRPSVAFLARHPEIVKEAYQGKKDPEVFERLIQSAQVGPIDEFPAPRAYIYQQVTKFVSYFGWAFILLIILYRYWRRKRRIIIIKESVGESKTTAKPVAEHQIVS